MLTANSALSDATLMTALDTIRQKCASDPELGQAIACLGQYLIESTGIRPESELQITRQNSTSNPEVLSSIEPTEGTTQFQSQDVASVSIHPPLDLSNLFSGKGRSDTVPIIPKPQPSGPAVHRDRLQIKAETCEWIIRKHLADQTGSTEEQKQLDLQMQKLREKAKPLGGGDVFWVCQPQARNRNEDLIRRLGRCYQNASRATNCVLRVMYPDEKRRTPQRLHQAFSLLAEACSALKVAIRGLRPKPDTDQDALFHWIRYQTESERVFLQRYMRIDDDADPEQWSELRARIETFENFLDEPEQARRLRKQTFNVLDYHLKKILHDSGDDSAFQNHWKKITKSVEDLVNEQGVEPDDPSLRDRFIPILDRLPEQMEMSENLRKVFQSIDDYLSSQEEKKVAESDTTTDTPIQWSSLVLRVREVLENKSILVIGGAQRPGALMKLKQAFGLTEVYWPKQTEHVTSAYDFEHWVAREETGLVLLAIRWSAHGYNDIQYFCKQYDKPLVRLPGGYHPNQVAEQIFRQAGRKLGLDSTTDH